MWDTGDVPTAKGSKAKAEALLASNGGEGGSVPQALGSKERRRKRRQQKKEDYSSYLLSPTWRKIRAAALKRDKNKCRACGCAARDVHHIRYPKKLGEEKMEWLFSLCVGCHGEIHRLAEKMPLRHATELVIESRTPVVRLPDDPRLSKSAAKWRQRKDKGKSKGKKRKGSVAPRPKKKSNLIEENERLREFFKANRERRSRREGMR